MSDEGTSAAIAILRDFYPRAEFPAGTVAAYTEVLSDWPSEEVVAAVRRLILTEKFLPSLAEIVREIAEARLTLPTPEQAWDIAERGSLRDAAPEVRAATEEVGGRWAILHSDRPSIVRAHFLRSYNERREHSIRAVARQEERTADVISLAPRPLSELPVTTRFRPRPLMAREAARLAGQTLRAPTDEERRDAIAILREGPDILPDQEPRDDPLYAAAERVFAEAGEWPAGALIPEKS